jgi:catechol 2,3-dioxygenase-like lactoylglutathione lyase family enzyme
MRPSVRVLTLGVDDLERSVTFYRDGLGLPTEGIVGEEFEHGAVAFFHLAGGLILALWPTASLAKDANIEASRSRLGSVSIGHIARSKEEVDEVIEAARRAGAVVTNPPQDRFWGGYSGYFHDPDGHLWEIAWNPELSPQELDTVDMDPGSSRLRTP